MMLLALISLPALFSDHMVLQRERANPIWGNDTPGQSVTMQIDGAPNKFSEVKVTTAADGTWRLLCPVLPAGGPYRLHLSGSSERVIDDVLVGDVWLASGQSNMEFPLAKAQNAAEEIAAAKYPKLRVAKVGRSAVAEAARQLNLSWTPCSPESAGAFSAVGYFFAREIQQHSGVPIGIIDSTWGGTPVEAWTSASALKTVAPDLVAQLAALKEGDAQRDAILADYHAKVSAWERTAFPQDESNTGEPAGWARPAFDDRDWRTMHLPNSIQSQGFAGNGAVWFRREIDLPKNWAGQSLVLELGAVDDFDTTYFNGQKIGATGPETLESYKVARRYAVPSELVRAGRNVIAVRVFDRFGEGGMMGPKLSAEPIPRGAVHALDLSGDWRWQVEREIPRVPASVLSGAPRVPSALALQSAPSYLFNGMIAPLVGYGVRGVIWYQGEANVGEAQFYRERFTALIRDWRTRWGEGTLPFYFVQLASYRQNPDWPRLREAQAQVLSEPATGMVVAIDVGEELDIHPRNKQAVGHRLALLARTRLFNGGNLVSAGPSLAQCLIEGDSVRVRWQSANGLNTSDGSPSVLGFELAGVDGVYHPATARIEHDDVVVRADGVSAPISVRYAWADFPTVNLQNAAKLPAVPFRTDGF